MAVRGGRVMLITGGASGIGAELARQAAEGRYSVVLADIDLANAERVAGEIGPRAMALPLDITSEAAWRQALDFVWSRFGRLDVLVNNAAVVHTGRARDVSIDRHQQTLDTNFMGPVKGMLAALPRFREQGRGHLVTICSMTAFLPFPGLASYAAAKHALRAFHHALALEERDGSTAFTIVHPSATETPMLDKEVQDDAVALAFAGVPMGASEVARIVLKAIGAKSTEICIPAARGPVVRRIGVSPRKLREMVERNEIVGRERQARMRAERSPSLD